MARDPDLQQEPPQPSPSNVPTPLPPGEVNQLIQEIDTGKDEVLQVPISIRPSSSSRGSSSESSASAPCNFQIPRVGKESYKRSGQRAPRALHPKVCSRPLWCSSISLSASFRRMYQAKAKAMEARRKAMISQDDRGHYDGPVPRIRRAAAPAYMLWIDHVFEKMTDSPLFPKRDDRRKDELPREAESCKICEQKKEKKKLKGPVSKGRVNRRGRCVVKVSLYARRRQMRRGLGRRCVCRGIPKRSEVFKKKDWRADRLGWVWGETDPSIPPKAKTVHHERTFYKDGFAKVNRMQRVAVMPFEYLSEERKIYLKEICLEKKLRREWSRLQRKVVVERPVFKK